MMEIRVQFFENIHYFDESKHNKNTLKGHCLVPSIQMYNCFNIFNKNANSTLGQWTFLVLLVESTYYFDKRKRSGVKKNALRGLFGVAPIQKLDFQGVGSGTHWEPWVSQKWLKI